MALAALRPVTKLSFRGEAETIESAAGRCSDVWVVGRQREVLSLAEKLAPLLHSPHLVAQAKSLKPGAGAAKAEGPWLAADGNLRKVTLVVLPEQAGRYVSPARSDVIASQLHGKVAGSEVILAVRNDQEVLASGLAVARCLPPYGAKAASPQEESTCHVSFYGCSVSDDTIRRLQDTADSIRVAQALVDMPPNVVHPTTMRECVLEAVAGLKGVSHTVIEGDALLKGGYGLLHAVGRSGQTPPCLVVVTHEGKAACSAKGVALVGKGITYDTGGAAIKPVGGMCGMKQDMGGAAGCFGAFLALAKAGGLPSGRKLHVVLCIAENGIGPTMFLNDDIITAKSGLTVEINNTDAEGRLVLADGVVHASTVLDCDLIVNMATLTGAQGVATGIHHALCLATDADLERQVISAGQSSGDLVHPGLFAPELLMHEFDSDFADLKNMSNSRTNAPSSCAGLFIHRHLAYTGYTGRWLHLDMAFPASAPLGSFATGWGVGLLSTLLGDAASDAASVPGFCARL